MLFKQEVTSGSLRLRKIRLTEEGDLIPPHDHNFDHTTVVIKGLFEVTLQPPGKGLETHLLRPGEHILVPAEALHGIKCVQPGEVWCAFSHRDPVTREVSITPNNWKAAYV